MKRFPEKRIFITGAGSGLGRSLALEFARNGWNVAAGDIDLERAISAKERAEKRLEMEAEKEGIDFLRAQAALQRAIERIRIAETR